MTEIGGYFGLACGKSVCLHEGVRLNSGRNAIRLAARVYGARRVYLPRYTCPVVPAALVDEGCEVCEYDLDERLMPASPLPTDAFVVYNNYFGVMGRNVAEMAARHPNLIVDNAQSFYAKPVGRAAAYSPRKFFGLPDGGIVLGEGITAEGLATDHSFDRCSHLLKRLDLGATAGYADFQREGATLDHAPILRMSPLTEALMGNIDYEGARRRRLVNFAILHEGLRSAFPFAQSEDDVPMVYPFVTDDPSLRARLIAAKIYVATYWPDVVGCDRLRDAILPLPIDQRYDEGDMNRILEVIHG